MYQYVKVIEKFGEADNLICSNGPRVILGVYAFQFLRQPKGNFSLTPQLLSEGRFSADSTDSLSEMKNFIPI